MPHPTHDNQAIAVIGMECRLPGADSVEAFWSNIRQGISSLGPAPSDRLDRAVYYDPTIGVVNRTYTDLGGVIKYRPVDRNVCPVTDELESQHDIVHLNLCETASRACLNAGIDPRHFPVRNTGVYIGNIRGGDIGSNMVVAANIQETLKTFENIVSDKLPGHQCSDRFGNLIRKVCTATRQWGIDGAPFTGANCAASLIAQVLKVNGPCIVFNSACASSLQALSQAMLALRLGNIDMAVVGGASYFHSDTLVIFSYARSLTQNRSCPFDDEANGLIVGEGCVVLLLKRLEDAIADGDPIQVIIREAGVSSDGKGKSLWAPRKEGQIEAMRRAYPVGGTDFSPADIGYIEAHATSTALGDATEMEALYEFFGHYLRTRKDNSKIPLGSSKGNVGHTLEVAGLTGLLKAALGIVHQTIPPVAGLKNLSKKIDWQNIPFYAPQTESVWETSDNKPRRAAVNAFGIGGLNVHVVVEEFIPDQWSRRKIEKSREKTFVTSLGSRHEPIAVIGYGGVLPGNLDLHSFSQFLKSNETAIRPVSKDKFDESLLKAWFFPDREDLPTFYGGFIDGYKYDWRKNRVPPKQIESANPLQFMILDAVNAAWETSRQELSKADRKRIGVVVGTAFGGDFSVELAITLFLPKLETLIRKELLQEGIDRLTIDNLLIEFNRQMLKLMPALIDETGSFTASAFASQITKSFDLMGGAVAIDAEYASSLAALGCCIDQLRTGSNDMMICISGQRDMGAVHFGALTATEYFSDNPRCSPFDRQFNGSVPGEGCGALLLKRLSDAKRDGDPVFAVIRGIGTCGGGENRLNQKISLQRGLENSGLDDCPVDFLEIATTQFTETTIHLLDAFMETQPSDVSRKTSLGALSDRIGHLGSAAGMASLLKSIIALSQREYPANPGIENIAPYIQRYRKTLEVPCRPVHWTAEESPKTVDINAGLFNIYNVILQEALSETNTL